MSDSTENKQRKPNSWLEHVKSVRDQYPEMIYRDALRLAKQTYKPVEKRKSPSKNLDEELDEQSVEN